MDLYPERSQVYQYIKHSFLFTCETAALMFCKQTDLQVEREHSLCIVDSHYPGGYFSFQPVLHKSCGITYAMVCVILSAGWCL